MISLIIVLIAFVWLLYETDFMRVRLPVGIIEQPIENETMSWNDIENAAQRHPGRQTFWLRHPQYMEPLCGWDWLRNRVHVVPDYKVELYFGNGYKQTFRLKKPELMKQIIKINTGKKYFAQLSK